MASPVDTSVKFFNENLPDAPVLNGVAGSLIGLLTACMVTGFGLRTAVSLVVSGGVATLTLANEAKNAMFHIIPPLLIFSRKLYSTK